jgi:hypothetical protein
MDSDAELCHSESDEVFFVIINDRWPKFKESAVMLKKWRNSLPVLKKTDKNKKITFHLENPNERDVTIFTILMVTNPFTTAKMWQWWFVI